MRNRRRLMRGALKFVGSRPLLIQLVSDVCAAELSFAAPANVSRVQYHLSS